MHVLDINTLNFNKLNILNCNDATEGDLYYDKEVLYKMFINSINVQRKKRKLMALNDGFLIPNVVIPDTLLIDNYRTVGCGMPYIDNSISFRKYRNSNSFIMLLYLISLSLKNIHNDPRNILIGDLHFNNIIIDQNLNHYFIDMDSCMIDGIRSDRIPHLLTFYVNFRNNFKFDISRETDRLCMYLATIEAIFGYDIDGLSMYEYDEKAEQIYTLKNMRKFILQIKNNAAGIPNIPYLDELISIKDFPAFRVKSMNIRKN